MSKFVNYNKRSVALPPGCKNLADVLQKTQIKNFEQVMARVQSAKIIRDECVTAPLSGIAKYILIVFESSNTVMLHMSSQDDQLTISLFKFDGQVSASVSVQHDSAQETRVRGFFLRQNLALPVESKAPESFDPNLPWMDSYEILPTPSDPPTLTQLVTDLLIDVCVRKDNSELRISCHELE